MPYDTETGDWIDEPQGQQQQGQPQGQPQRTNAEWKEFRQEQTRAKKLERENAFLKAGINPDASPLADLFVKGYDGDLTPDAIRAKATEVGILQAQGEQQTPAEGQPTPEQVAAAQQAQAELGAQQRVGQASTGAAPVPTDPSTLLQDAFAKGGEGSMLDMLAQAGVPIAHEGVITSGQ
jgi:hypothetical protein